MRGLQNAVALYNNVTGQKLHFVAMRHDNFVFQAQKMVKDIYCICLHDFTCFLCEEKLTIFLGQGVCFGRTQEKNNLFPTTHGDPNSRNAQSEAALEACLHFQFRRFVATSVYSAGSPPKIVIHLEPISSFPFLCLGRVEEKLDLSGFGFGVVGAFWISDLPGSQPAAFQREERGACQMAFFLGKHCFSSLLSFRGWILTWVFSLHPKPLECLDDGPVADVKAVRKLCNLRPC